MFRFIILTVIGCFLCGESSTVYAQKRKPVLFTIGDSTVRNGDGSGSNGQWGWGSVIDAFFDLDNITIKNQAIGGRSSRTFIEENRWQQVLDSLQQGDFVLIQFGHNDGGSLNKDRARGTLKGSGDETETVIMEATGKENTIHTHGWYIRKYIREAKEKGATPIVCSLIPRNIWKDGQVERNDMTYAKWTKEACEQEGALFINLNELVAQRYEVIGEEVVRREFFKDGDHTHTTYAGALQNAVIITTAISHLGIPLKQYLSVFAK